MVKVNIFGNAFAHRLSYGRGVHLVNPAMAERLVEAGVAEILETEEGIEVAVMPEPEDLKKAVPLTMETLTAKPKKAPRAKAKKRKK